MDITNPGSISSKQDAVVDSPDNPPADDPNSKASKPDNLSTFGSSQGGSSDNRTVKLSQTVKRFGTSSEAIQPLTEVTKPPSKESIDLVQSGWDWLIAHKIISSKEPKNFSNPNSLTFRLAAFLDMGDLRDALYSSVNYGSHEHDEKFSNLLKAFCSHPREVNEIAKILEVAGKSDSHYGDILISYTLYEVNDLLLTHPDIVLSAVKQDKQYPGLALSSLGKIQSLCNQFPEEIKTLIDDIEESSYRVFDFLAGFTNLSKPYLDKFVQIVNDFNGKFPLGFIEYKVPEAFIQRFLRNPEEAREVLLALKNFNSFYIPEVLAALETDSLYQREPVRTALLISHAGDNAGAPDDWEVKKHLEKFHDPKISSLFLSHPEEFTRVSLACGANYDIGYSDQKLGFYLSPELISLFNKFPSQVARLAELIQSWNYLEYVPKLAPLSENNLEPLISLLATFKDSKNTGVLVLRGLKVIQPKTIQEANQSAAWIGRIARASGWHGIDAILSILSPEEFKVFGSDFVPLAEATREKFGFALATFVAMAQTHHYFNSLADILKLTPFNEDTEAYLLTLSLMDPKKEIADRAQSYLRFGKRILKSMPQNNLSYFSDFSKRMAEGGLREIGELFCSYPEEFTQFIEISGVRFEEVVNVFAKKDSLWWKKSDKLIPILRQKCFGNGDLIASVLRGLAVLEELSPADLEAHVEDYINATVDLAQNKFTNWRIIKDYANLVPFSPVSLGRLKQVSLDPASQAIVAELEKTHQISLQIVTPDNLDIITSYANFMMSLSSEHHDSFIKKLDFSQTARLFVKKNNQEVVDFADRLDALLGQGEGDRFVLAAGRKPKALSILTHKITLANLDDIYTSWYLFRASSLQRNGFPAAFSFDENFSPPQVKTLQEISELLKKAFRLQALLGDKLSHAFLENIFRKIDFKTLDTSDATKKESILFDLPELEKLRQKVNAVTGNVGGDNLIQKLGESFIAQEVTADNFSHFLKFTEVWKNTGVLNDYLLRDIEGHYIQRSNFAATKLRDYIERKPTEAQTQTDYTKALAYLASIGFPVQVSAQSLLETLDEKLVPETKTLAKAQTKLKKKEKPVVSSLKSEVTVSIPKISPEDQVLLDYLSKTSLKDIDHNNPVFKNPDFNNLANLESIRAHFGLLLNEKGNVFFTALINSYLHKLRIDVTTLDIYHHFLGILVKGEEVKGDFSEQYKMIAQFVAQIMMNFIQENKQQLLDRNINLEGMLKDLASVGIYPPSVTSDTQKGLTHLEKGDFGYLAGKLWTKAQQGIRRMAGLSDVNEKFKTTEIKRDSVKGSLPGYLIEKIFLADKHVATLITGDHVQGARVNAEIQVGGGIKHSELANQHKDNLVYQGPVTLVSGGNKGIDLMAKSGQILNPSVNPRGSDGYVILYPDGSMHLANKRNLRLSDLTRRSEDQYTKLDVMNVLEDYQRFVKAIHEKRLTILTSMLFENDGTALKFSRQPSGEDSRRYLLEFPADEQHPQGRFGMIDSEEDMSINELLTLSYRLGATRIVYCDTGMYDMASFYTYDNGVRHEQMIGWKDAENSSNRIMFLSKVMASIPTKEETHGGNRQKPPLEAYLLKH